jgi:hypothetical protein
VQKVDVDVVGLEAGAGILERLDDLGGLEVVRGDLVRDDRVLAAAHQPLAEHRLRVAGGVGLGGVEEGDAEVERAVDGADALRVVRASPPLAAHRPGAEAEDRNGDAARA